MQINSVIPSFDQSSSESRRIQLASTDPTVLVFLYPTQADAREATQKLVDLLHLESNVEPLSIGPLHPAHRIDASSG